MAGNQHVSNCEHAFSYCCAWESAENLESADASARRADTLCDNLRRIRKGTIDGIALPLAKTQHPRFWRRFPKPRQTSRKESWKCAFFTVGNGNDDMWRVGALPRKSTPDEIRGAYMSNDWTSTSRSQFLGGLFFGIFKFIFELILELFYFFQF